MHSLLIPALFISICFDSFALECRVLMTEANKDINQTIETCLIPTIPVIEVKVVNVTNITEINTDDDPEEPSDFGPRRGINLKPKRQIEFGANRTRTTTTRRPLTTAASTKPPFRDHSNDPKRCVVLCILKHYGMLNPKGYPEIEQISSQLIGNTDNRQLKDFLQDSVDDCFFEVSELVDAVDNCTYSAKLVTCLADKGRANCADWPVGELPFPHYF